MGVGEDGLVDAPPSSALSEADRGQQLLLVTGRSATYGDGERHTGNDWTVGERAGCFAGLHDDDRPRLGDERAAGDKGNERAAGDRLPASGERPAGE